MARRFYSWSAGRLRSEHRDGEAVHVLHAHLAERPDDGALEQVPDAFNAVRVYVTPDPFLSAVIDRLMARLAVPDTEVGFEFVRVDRLGIAAHSAPDKIVYGVLAAVGDRYVPAVSSSSRAASIT